MDFIETIGVCLFLYSFTVTISLFVADYKVKENFTWITASLCFVWPITLVLIFLNYLWENGEGI